MCWITRANAQSAQVARQDDAGGDVEQIPFSQGPPRQRLGIPLIEVHASPGPSKDWHTPPVQTEDNTHADGEVSKVPPGVHGEPGSGRGLQVLATGSQ